MARVRRVALVYGAPVGAGGLGVQVASAVQGLAIEGVELHLFGPGRIPRWPLPGPEPAAHWHQAPPGIADWRRRFTWLRWYSGRLVLVESRRIGRWAAGEIERLAPDLCYVFTQVGLETLRWAQRARVATVLESPNGHIRNFRRVVECAARSCGAAHFRGHPSPAMVARVEGEYRIADRIRVSSQWSRRSLIGDGVSDKEIAVFEQPLNLLRYRPANDAPAQSGPLRICFVGSLDLRKGFVHLLQAAKLIDAAQVAIEIVGATGDRLSRKVFALDSIGLAIRAAPGDPIPVYHRSELFVLPSLEDGSPFAAAEAMACGLPVIVSDCCGAAEWVRPGETGWIVRGGDSEDLARALRLAIERRSRLRAMGEAARRDTERRTGPRCLAAFRQWMFGNATVAG